MTHRALAFFIIINCICSSLVPAQLQGEKIFSKSCASCHTIGMGDLVGPDLANIHTRRAKDWITRFIISPREVVNSGDSVANDLFKKYRLMMPDHQLSTTEINSILTYIETKSSVSANNNSGPAVYGFISASRKDIEIGKNIFEGNIKLKNGGAACIWCHKITGPGIFNGGLLAKDLTHVASRLGTEGIGAILTNPPFPAMADAFINKPLTKNEINYLLAFFSYTDNTGVITTSVIQEDFVLILAVIIVSVYLLTFFLFFWQKVKKHSVNTPNTINE